MKNKKIVRSLATAILLGGISLGLTGCDGARLEREVNCNAQGGHFWNPPGKASNLCLTDDGRILEV